MSIKVKALVWSEHAIPPSGEWLAQSEVGLYCITICYEAVRLRLRDKYIDRLYDTVDAAKAAAQADYERRILSAIEPSPDMREAMEALRSMESAPKDGTDILVYYNHDADPYQDSNNPDRLTDYAAWAEGGPFMDGKGWCIAAWKEPHWESTDEYGSGYWMPAYWFARQHDDYEVVVNPVAWMPLLSPPSDN